MRWLAVLVPLLFALPGAFIVPASAATAAKPCDEPTTIEEPLEGWTVSGDVEVDCRVWVDGDVIVTGTLTLAADASVVFVGGSSYVFHVKPSGTLEMENETEIDVVDDGAAYEFRVDGKVVGLDGTCGECVVDPAIRRIVGASSVSLTDVDRKSVPTMDSVAVADLGGSMQVTDSQVILTRVLIEGSSGAALQVASSRVQLRSVDVTDNPLGLVLASGAHVEAVGGVWQRPSSSDAPVATLSAPDARLYLNGTGAPRSAAGDPDAACDSLAVSIESEHAAPFTPTNFDLAAGALVELRARVTTVVKNATSVPVGDALVELRAANNSVMGHWRSAHLTGEIPDLFPLVARFVGGEAPEWGAAATLSARKAFNAAQAPLDLDAKANLACIIVLPDVEDKDKPVWPDPPAGETILNVSDAADNDGVVRLSWLPAQDVGPEGANISHYRVYRMRDGGSLEPVESVAQTEWNATLPSPGRFTFRVIPVDLVGNRGEFSNAISTVYDAKAPWYVVVRNGTVGPDATWFRSNVTFNATALDDWTQPLSVNRSVKGPFVAESGPHGGNVTFTEDGRYTVTLDTTDEAGNRNQTAFGVGVDRARPVMAVGVLPSQPNGGNGWYQTPPTVLVDASDALSGLHDIRWRPASQENWTTLVDDDFKVDRSGAHTVVVNATDRAGNTREVRFELNVDLTPPSAKWKAVSGTLDGEWISQPVKLKIEAADNESGLLRTDFAVGDGAWSPYLTGQEIVVEAAGVTRLFLRAFDEAGNVVERDPLVVRFDATPPRPGKLAAASPEPGLVKLDWSAAPPSDDESGVATVALERRGVGDATDVSRTSLPDAVMTLFEQRNVPAGVWEYRLAVTDASGRHASSDWVRVQVEAPAVSLEVGDPFRKAVQGVVELRPARADLGPEPVTKVEFRVDGQVVHVTSEPPYTWQFDTRMVKDGSHGYQIIVHYASGTYEEAGVVQVDNDRPVTSGHEIWLATAAGALVALNGVVWAFGRRAMRVLEEGSA